jgi:hypothetical protein
LIAYNRYQKDFDKGIYKILQERLIFDPGLKNEFCKSRIMIQIDQSEVYGSTSNLHQIYNILIYAISLGIIPIYEKMNFESSFQAKDLLNNKILLKKKYLLKYNMYYNPLYLPFTTLIPYIGNIENDSKGNMSEFLDLLDEELTKKYDPKSIPEKTADQ